MIPMIEAAGQVAGLITGVLDRVLPKKMTEAERAAVELELMKVDWQSTLGQLEINKIEAAHESIFVAGWRPFVGWVCGSAFAYHFVVQPLLLFLVALYAWQVPPLPALDTGSLMTVLLGMLGLGGLRTFEKFEGVNKKR